MIPAVLAVVFFLRRIESAAGRVVVQAHLDTGSSPDSVFDDVQDYVVVQKLLGEFTAEAEALFFLFGDLPQAEGTVGQIDDIAGTGDILDADV